MALAKCVWALVAGLAALMVKNSSGWSPTKIKHYWRNFLKSVPKHVNVKSTLLPELVKC